MKFLLVAVNAKYIHSNPAIYSLRAYGGRESYQHIEIAEYSINHYSHEILSDIYIRQPDVVGFSCYIWNWGLIQEVMVDLHNIIPELPIWLGGPEVTYEARKIIQQYPFIAGIVIGEGEVSFRDLMEFYITKDNNPKEDTDLKMIPGLCLSSGYTPHRNELDIDSLPFIYDEVESFQNKIIYYESSRGCPYQCSYCLSSMINIHTTPSKKRIRLRDLNQVREEIQFFLDHKVKQVKFVDRTFNCIHEHAMDIWRYLKENDNGITNFHFEVSAELFIEDEINLLKQLRPGLVQLEIGVQSTNPHSLEAVHRFFDIKKLEKNVRALHEKQNIHLHLDLIAGLPYEDYMRFGESFNTVYAMKPHQLQLGFLKILKGSGIHGQVDEYGIGYSPFPPYEVLYTKWLPYQDILRLKKIEEMVEQFYNSNQFHHSLSFLSKVFTSPFAMYEAMAEFWGTKGYFTNNPARVYRYQALLDFAEEWDQGNIAIYRELLLYDMYLRENLKSRPDFAPAIYREEINRFYREEEEDRKWLPEYRQYNAKQMRKMTHMEYFRYPVWDMCLEDEFFHYSASNLRSEKNPKSFTGAYVLFDYRKRHPVTNEADTLFFCDGFNIS